MLPLVAAGMYWFSARSTPVPTTGTVIESASTPVTVTLRDGSSLALDAHTRLRLLRDEPQDVDVELETGKANFDVTHVGGRAFRVHAGIVQVKVLGTRFEVAKTPRKEGTHIQVAVARGVVEVQRQDGTGGVRRLNAAETWSALIPNRSLTQASGPPARLPTQVTTAPVTTTIEAAPEKVQAPAPSPQPRVADQLGDKFTPERAPPARDQREERRLAREERRNARARAAALARERTVNSASLFKRANLARRTGQTHEAADAYAEFLRRFADDGRAGIVAFELGRIRMDALAQPKAAVDAFAVALRSAPRASFREDALARIVVADDQLGETEACLSARERYLKDFPNGVHALALATRCGKSGR
jgi:transmembrane sensor